MDPAEHLVLLQHPLTFAASRIAHGHEWALAVTTASSALSAWSPVQVEVTASSLGPSARGIPQRCAETGERLEFWVSMCSAMPC